MHQTKRTYVLPGSNLASLIDENPAFLLMLEHFGLNPLIQDKCIEELCLESGIPAEIFLCIANLYNGFIQPHPILQTTPGILSITRFLNNSHKYYKEEKYPEIRAQIRNLMQSNTAPETRLVERFFDDYFDEVTEHLNYEDQVVFPYIQTLMTSNVNTESRFSVEEYQDHHSDIESKLEDLKNLLLKHIPVHGDAVSRRRLLMSLYELESDLSIHTQIEDRILIPMVRNLETTSIS